LGNCDGEDVGLKSKCDGGANGTENPKHGLHNTGHFRKGNPDGYSLEGCHDLRLFSVLLQTSISGTSTIEMGFASMAA
jgi:hypothetical protein